MRLLIDTTVLIEAERRKFDLRQWIQEHQASIAICDATLAEYLAGEPIKDGSRRKRFRDFWETVVSQLPSRPITREVCARAGALLFLARSKQRTVPLGDALHGAVADLEGLTVLTVDTAHFADLGVSALNPLAPARAKA